MEKFDLDKYKEQLEKLKAELEKELDMNKELSSGQKIVEKNVEVSAEEKNNAMKSLLKDSKQVYKKLQSRLRKLKVKAFFKKILGALLIGAGWLTMGLAMATFVALIGGLITVAGTGIVSLGAVIAKNSALLSTCLEILKISAIVTASGAISAAVVGALKEETLNKVMDATVGVGSDMTDSMYFYIENSEMIELLNEAKSMYKNLKLQTGQEKHKTEGVAI